MKKKIDPALDVPAESNRSKHVNFLAYEEKARGVKTKDSTKFIDRIKDPVQSRKEDK